MIKASAHKVYYYKAARILDDLTHNARITRAKLHDQDATRWAMHAGPYEVGFIVPTHAEHMPLIEYVAMLEESVRQGCRRILHKAFADAKVPIVEGTFEKLLVPGLYQAFQDGLAKSQLQFKKKLMHAAMYGKSYQFYFPPRPEPQPRTVHFVERSGAWHPHGSPELD